MERVDYGHVGPSVWGSPVGWRVVVGLFRLQVYMYMYTVYTHMWWVRMTKCVPSYDEKEDETPYLPPSLSPCLPLFLSPSFLPFSHISAFLTSDNFKLQELAPILIVLFVLWLVA